MLHCETQAQCVDITQMSSALSGSDVAKVKPITRARQDCVVAADTPLNWLFMENSCYEQEL